MGLSLVSMIGRWEGVMLANLERWGHLFDEVVVGVDARADDSVVARLSGRVDRLIIVDGLGSFANSAWLVPSATSQWSLVIDSDEVISVELGAYLQARSFLEASNPAAALRMRWCWPDGSTWLDDEPWRYDPQVRLLDRNSWQRNWPTGLHEAVDIDGPVMGRPEALYHLDLVLNSETARREKAARYRANLDAKMSGHQRDLNSNYYIPEDRLRAPTLRYLSATNQEIVMAGVMAATDPDRARARAQQRVTSITRHHVDDLFADEDRRRTESNAEKPRLSVLSCPSRLIAGVAAPVELLVENSSKRILWPRCDGRGVAVGWTARRESEIVGSGRGELTMAVGAGEQSVVVAWLLLECEPGTVTVEFDLVDEGIEWLNVTCTSSFVLMPAGESYDAL